MRKTKPFSERFWKKVQKTPSCWLWTASGVPRGYGHMLLTAGKFDYAHRISYRLHKGEIPAGMFVCHTCDNPKCVNPEHLFLSTHKGNMEDMRSKGRQPDKSGENQWAAKLTKEQVLEIRELAKSHRQKDIAEKFEISPSMISSIVHKRYWTKI